MDLTDDKTTDRVVSTPVTALRRNGYVVIDERPGQIVELSSSDNERHIVARDLATGAKLKATVADDENVDVPDATRFERQLLDCENGVITVKLDNGDAKYEVPLPTNEVGDRIKRLFVDEAKDVIVTFLSVLGEEIVVSAVEATTPSE
ncbi:eukaryotic translation initiation factor 5A [Penicillium brevicompactum]|uniref:Eukaryotic translation initiation factor 5A n=1 Tax=Penicillium brevicompactum TaxID=5074 RepID=A0A9W9U7I6_PENBR|nr:eukaryotic translation initiation factor 5A [Penicillium brevicompactum]